MNGDKRVDLLQKYGGTEFTGLEVLMIGDALLTWVSTMSTLGHQNPSSTLDYTQSTGLIWNDIVRDFVAFASGRTPLAPGCEERLRGVVLDSGWARFSMDRVAERLSEAMGAEAQQAA